MRTALRRTAAALWVLAVALTAAYFALRAAGGGRLPAQIVSVENYVLEPAGLSFVTVGALIVNRYPRHLVGWLLIVCGFTGCLEAFGQVYGVESQVLHHNEWPASDWGLWLDEVMWAPGFILAPSLLPMLFPDGTLPSRRWRPAAAGALAAAVLALLLEAFSNTSLHVAGVDWRSPMPWHLPWDVNGPGPLNVSILCFVVAAYVAGGAALVVRFRESTGERRQQLKWFAYSAAVVIALMSAGLVGVVLTGRQVPLSVSLLGDVGLGLLPVAIGLAIFRYRLYDIDIVISRTLMYTALAAVITVVYVAVVAGLGQLVGTSRGSNLGVSILATALIALFFQPLRDRLRRVADRLVFGARATPYETLANFSHRLAGAPTIDDLLPTVARAAAAAAGAAGAEAVIALPGGGTMSAVWPAGFDPDLAVRSEPVVHLEEHLGEFRLGASDGVSQGELMRALTGHAGVLFRNVRLTLELERRLEQISERNGQLRSSRLRLVAAADAMRRSLEEEISKGPGQELESISRSIAGLLESVRSPEAPARLEAMSARATQALEQLRELARGVYPPLLTDRGIVPALEAHLRKIPLQVELGVEPGLAKRRFDPQVENAVYFCCVSALQVAHRLGATRAGLDIDLEGGLRFRLRASGLTAPPDVAAGQDMLDRVEVLGGTLALTVGARSAELVGVVPVGRPDLEPAMGMASA